MPNAKRPTHTSSPIAVIEIESSPEPELEYIAPRRVTRSASRARSVSAQPPPQSQGKGKGREKPASKGNGRKPVPLKAPVHLGAVIELTDSEPEVEPVAGPSRTRTPARTPSHTRLNFNALQAKPAGASTSADNIPVASGSGSGSQSSNTSANTNARKRKLGPHATPLFLPSDEENEPPFTFSDDEDGEGRGAKKLHLHRGKDKGKGKEKEKTNDNNYKINYKGKDKGKGKQKAAEEVIDVDLEVDPHRNLDADLEDDWDPEFSKKPFPFHFVDDDPLRAVLAPEPEPEVPIQKAAEPKPIAHRPAESRPVEPRPTELRPAEHRPAAPAPAPPPAAPAPVLEPVDVFLPRRMQPLPGAEPFQWGGPVLRLPQLVEERFENAVVPFPAPARVPAPVAPANHPAPAQLLQPPAPPALQIQAQPQPNPAPELAPEPEPGIDPASKAVAQVLEIIPDVEPAYLLELIQTHLPNFQGQTAEHVVGVLFEAGDYPRVEKTKNKGKRKSDVGIGWREEEEEGRGEGSSKKVKVDYASVERPLVGGQDYTELALVQLQTSFPLIPKPYLRQTLQRHRGLYAPTHLFLAAAERTYAAAQAQYPGAHPGRPYVLKSTRYNPNKDRKRMKDVVCEAFVEERRWLVEYLQDPGETDAMTAGANNVGAGAVGGGEVEGKGKGKEKAVVEEDGPLEEGTGIECQCCFAEYAFDKMVQCAEAHLFCRDCVSQYASTKLGEHNHLINCMHESGCKEPFPVSELRRILSPKLMDLYERVKQQKEIEAAGLEGLEECPFCEWKCVLEVSSEEEKLFRCGNEEGGCGVVSCRLCKKKEHLPKTCQEAEEDKHLDGRHAIEEAMTRALMRNCPKCNKAFIKEAGCNKMTCPNCRTLSCYVCRKVITGYDHFDQTPAGRPSTSKKSGKCMLWDQVEERHANEVKAAAEKALQEYKLAHPEVEEKDIKVDVPVAPPPPAQAQAQPVNRPMLPGVQVVAGGVHYQIPPAHFQAGRWAGLNVNFNYNNMAPGQGFGFGIAPAAQVQHAVHVVHPYQHQLAQPIFGRLQPQAQAQIVQVPPPLVVPQRPVRVQPAPAAPAPRVAQARQRQQALRRQVQQARQAAALPVPAPAPAPAPALVQQHQQPRFQPVQNYAVQHLGGQARAQADLEEAQRLVAQEGYRQRLRTHQEQFQQIQQMRRQDEEMNARLRQMAQRARAAAAAQAAVAGPARRARR